MLINTDVLNIKPNIVKKYAEQIPFNIIYDKEIRIIMVASSWVDEFNSFSKKLKKTDYILILDWGWHHDYVYSRPKEFLSNCNYPKNIIFLSNCVKIHNERKENGFNSIFCSNNTFINTDIFNIKPNIVKKYKMVINSRATEWKNISFAQDIDDIALIVNKNPTGWHGGDDTSYLEMKYTYLNKNRLQPEEVAEIINQSRVGGIFSFAEGACFANSEFLLCGIPIVSVHSKGGRDIYYDDYNSIIVGEPIEIINISKYPHQQLSTKNPDTKDIKNACEKLIRERKDPNIIRNNHLKIIEAHEKSLINKIQEIFDENYINLKSSEWFYKEKNNSLLNKKVHFMKSEGKNKKICDIINILEK